MNVGMLWYDIDPRTALTLKVNHAGNITVRNMAAALTYAWSARPCSVKVLVWWMYGRGRISSTQIDPSFRGISGSGSMKKTKSFLVQEEVTDPNRQLPRQPQWRLPYYD